MEKHLTLRDTPDDGKEQYFSEQHLEALRGGAARRKKEQLVGNWIRLANPTLFARLLVEASTPPKSAILDSLDEELLFSPSGPTVAQSTPILGAAPQSHTLEVKEVQKEVYRKPPPQINII